MNQPNLKRIPLADIYRNLYPWNSLNSFVEQIKNTVAYKSDDNSVIALTKPYGVGVYTVNDTNSSKQNQDKLLSRVPGRPRYCIQDALKPLTDEFSPKAPYSVLKGIDRYMSGLVLITNNPSIYETRFKKSLTDGRIRKIPPYGMRAITNGYPTINSKKIFERVGLELVEIDELGDYKEPVIVSKVSRKYLNNSSPDLTSFQVEMEVMKVNREYSAALLELYVSKLKFDFPRCYISSKTSFILGDVRFSKRIRNILGKQIQVSAFRSSHNYQDDYEPLNGKIRDLLGVRNASIPLMLDFHCLRLANFNINPVTKKKEDLIIKSPFMPAHFAHTANKLELLE